MEILPFKDFRINVGKEKINNGPIIPKNLWIAVVNKTEVLQWDHIQKEIKMNPTWTIYICDNNDKDKFMRKYFNGTSLLWAYESINPSVGGAAKADIWRYAVLYSIGGVYIDADSYLSKPLDTFIHKDDHMIIPFESNNFDGDWCYSPNSKLSTYRSLVLHPISKKINLFNNRNILNWCIVTSPHHRFLKRTLENFVYLVKREYIGLSELKIAKHDQFSKHVYWYYMFDNYNIILYMYIFIYICIEMMIDINTYETRYMYMLITCVFVS